MSNYRDTVREMMRDLKAGKELLPKEGAPSSGTGGSMPPEALQMANEANTVMDVAEAAGSDLPMPNEEDLLDDILDLEEGAPAPSSPIQEAEAEKLLAPSPEPEPEPEPEHSPSQGKSGSVFSRNEGNNAIVIIIYCRTTYGRSA